ncbi:MAG: hypothetical protein KU29_04100 [Sulfurovum sp. FS06-10]|nr:MAG: hypothetical protein KU29_04100 [Sulfurovum sp. FS06-10]
MQKIFFLFLFPFFLTATELKIATYNVENLFDMYVDGHEYREYIPNKHNWTRTTLNKKLLNISEVICDINADIVGLQEIENENALTLLQNSLRSVGCAYNYWAITHKQNSTIQVALLSKIPIQSSKDIVVSRVLGQRNILEVKYTIEGNPLFIYVNHWNSKRSPESKRMVSARALKNRLLSLPKGVDYIVLGDLNSNYDEYATMEPKHNDTQGKTGINDVLQTTLNGTLLDETAMKSTDFLHYNLWLELVKFQRWSHNFYGKKQGLDVILLPPSLFNGKGIDYVNNSFQVVKLPYLFHKKGYIYRWQYRAERHLGKGYSDHLPLVATFSTKPYIFEKQQSMIVGKIEDLYTKNLNNSLRLNGVKVILKRGHHAIIKASKEERAIFVYGADGLEEGHCYDIVVNKIKSYQGLHEVVDFIVEHDYGKVAIEEYFYNKAIDFNNKVLENEVIQNLVGVYKKGKFYVGEKGYRIFFKNRDFKPTKGSRLKLNRVQIGYYNALQLVVWDVKDITVLE